MDKGKNGLWAVLEIYIVDGFGFTRGAGSWKRSLTVEMGLKSRARLRKQK